MAAAHATKAAHAADDHDASPLPLPWPRPAPLLVILSLLAGASYLALTRVPAFASSGRLVPAALLPIAPPRPHDSRSRDSCAGFYAGAGPSRAVTASVEEFGAVGDGATPNTAAFRRAVAELEARAGAGGARLEVPPGRWLTGSFNITSRFTLFLHRGAVILGSQVTDSFVRCFRDSSSSSVRFTSIRVLPYTITVRRAASAARVV